MLSATEKFSLLENILITGVATVNSFAKVLNPLGWGNVTPPHEQGAI